MASRSQPSAAVCDLRPAACDIQALVLQSAVSGQPPAASSQKQSAICDLQPWCSGKQGSSSMRTKSPDAGDLPLRPGQFRNRDGTNKDKKKRKASCSITRTGCSSNRQRPILPDRFQSSTFGVQGLNYCVRHGNRWIPLAIVTGYVVEGLSPQNFMKRHCNVLSSLRTHFSY